MADPKYANLPGIAFDQPDFYESEDVSTSHQDAFLTQQDLSDSVEKLSTNVEDSYSKFRGHWLDSNRVDFSGKIASKHLTGYPSCNGPYELQAFGEKEDMLEKLNRLKCEVAELAEEVAKNNLAGDAEDIAFAGNLNSHMENLQKQLLAIKIKENVGMHGLQLSSGHQSANKCISELEEVLKLTANNDRTTTEVKTASQVIYTLHFKPHEVQLEMASKVSKLTNRLERLEQILGASNQEKLDRLTAESGQKCLIDIVKLVHLKCSLLDLSQMDLFEARLGVIIQKLNNIADKGAVLEEMDKASKVKEVYETVKKLDPLMAVVPCILDRLLALKNVHEEAVSFSDHIGHLESKQCQLDQTLMTQSKLLTEIQAGLLANMEIMKEAMKEMQTMLKR